MTKQRDDDHPQEGLEDKNGQIVDMADGYTPEEEKEVLRKIDLAIMPMYLDKQSLSYASVGSSVPGGQSCERACGGLRSVFAGRLQAVCL
ncbi:hypothetical protein CH063_15542 [Colletotrichum higginsianum]|uniref:Uncharacterized protein n=1 Tax=Colletotrichum higginsianum (strain IMI 349063) TaxID=759273 RepID=H1W3A5_COLHI|nr:hypothetical protein CH063_15542 [Colletotrichum higginsianum]